MQPLLNKTFRFATFWANSSHPMLAYYKVRSTSGFAFHPKLRANLKVFHIPENEAGNVKITLLIGLFVVIGVVGGLGLERQNLSDWLALRNYQAPNTVSQLAAQDTMTQYAKKVFFVNHPAISSKADFAPVCPKGTEQTVVLGCYHSDQDGIYVLQVTDPILNGVEQVTAAHETLHAVYDRLSPSKRTQVDGWLEDYYQNGLQDPTIKAQIADYKKSEPAAVVNEMHSLFGTEVAQLPPQLESYYKQYFTNRAAIVANYTAYEAAFTTRQNSIKQADAQLKIWDTQISANEKELESKQTIIKQRQAKMQTLNDTNQVDAYNSQVPGYNALVNDYNSEAAATRSLIAQYNQLVSDRNALVLEQQQLASELNSNPQTLKK